MKTYPVGARLAFVAALVMVGATWVSSFLTAVNVYGLQCCIAVTQYLGIPNDCQLVTVPH